MSIVELERDRFLALFCDAEVALRFDQPLVGLGSKPEDVAVRERVRDVHEFNLVVEGAITGEIGGQPVSAGSGSLLWFMPGKPHSLCWHKGLMYYYISFTLSRAEAGYSLRDNHVLVEKAWDLRRHMHDVIRTHAGAEPYREARLRILMGFLAGELFVRTSPRRGSRYKNVFTFQQKRTLEEYYHRNTGKPVSPRELAACLKLSYDYFSRIFRNTYGVSPRDWIVRERVGIAAVRLLEGRRKIQDLADELGYRDIYFFSRQFKQITGLSPLAFRKNHVALSNLPEDEARGRRGRRRVPGPAEDERGP